MQHVCMYITCRPEAEINQFLNKELQSVSSGDECYMLLYCGMCTVTFELKDDLPPRTGGRG